MTVWNIKSPDPQLVSKLEQSFKVPEIIARVLANRGIHSVEESRSFFNPDISALHDPFKMLNMEKAAQFVTDLIKTGKKILVFGDYDVDGTTGASMLYLLLRSVGARVDVYIPDREKEGYGLSTTAVDHAIQNEVELIITCDCGINALESVRYANSNNIRVVITDHHMPDTVLPDAFAILNPKQENCNYPFKGLCGGGVSFKLASAIIALLDVDPELVTQHLDLITLGTAADIVPIIDENRVIVHHGLDLLPRSDKPGIRALLKVSGLADQELTVGRLIFWAAPRINAAGRIGDANRAVKLLTTENFAESVQLAKQLENENRFRQEIQQTIVDEALFKINSEVDLENEKAIVLWKEGWHRGVIGIVASKIKEIFHRPAVVIGMDGNTGKGSARSIKEFDLYENLTLCADILDGYGGHPMAAGLSISAKNLDHFRNRFVSIANETLSDNDLINTFDIEGEMTLSVIDKRFMDFLRKLAPYGPGNMRPQFVIRNVRAAGTPRLVGTGSNHLKFRAKQDSTVYDAIGFNMATYYEHLITGKPFDIVSVIEENQWQGSTTIQLNVRDIKPSKRESG